MSGIENSLDKCFKKWTCLKREQRAGYMKKARTSGRRAIDIFIDECLAKQERNRKMNEDMKQSSRRVLSGFRILGMFWGKP